MDLQFTFKKMDSSASLMDMAIEKITPRVNAFSGPCINPHVTFSAERGMQKIHFSMLTSDGFRIEVHHEGPDIYAELDEVADRIETQLKRHKEKRLHHKGDIGLRATAPALASNGEPTMWDEVLTDEAPIDAKDVLKLENARKVAPWSHP